METFYLYFGMVLFWLIAILLVLTLILLARKYYVKTVSVFFPKKTNNYISWQIWRALNGTEKSRYSFALLNSDKNLKPLEGETIRDRRYKLRLAEERMQKARGLIFEAYALYSNSEKLESFDWDQRVHEEEDLTP